MLETVTNGVITHGADLFFEDTKAAFELNAGNGFDAECCCQENCFYNGVKRDGGLYPFIA